MRLFELITEDYDNWDHEYPAKYSQHLEDTFGEPDEKTDEQTVWHNKDGFKRIVCRDEYILHGSPAPHYDFVYCYIDLEVPEELSDELAKCSGSILIDHLKNEVGARCGSLTANATTLNFVLDVVAGRTEPVKEEYESRIKAMTKMFDDGETYSVDWWPDESGDANPKNPYYTESLQEINRYTSTSTSDAGVTTTKMPGGYKSVQNDAGTTTYNPDGTKMSQTRSVPGFKQELKFKGGPLAKNVKNTTTLSRGDVDVTKTTDGAGRMTSAGLDTGNANVRVDNKGNASAAYQITDRDRMRVSTQMPLTQRMQQLNKLKSVGSM